MNDARIDALECPDCGAPVGFRAPFCAYCRRPLTWGAAVEVRREGVVLRCDAQRDLLPGEKLFAADVLARRPDGVLLTVPDKQMRIGRAAVKMRNAAVSLEAVGLDPGSSFGVMARIHEQGKIFCSYGLLVQPHVRSFQVSLHIEGASLSCIRTLQAWEFSEAIAPLGQPNQIELRCADSLLQVWVNGRFLTSLSDPTFGYGFYGWRASSLLGTARTLIRSFAIARAR